MECDVNYDSDAVDENIEASLYASVYFDQEEEENPVPKNVFSQIDEAQTRVQSTLNESPSQSVQPIQKPQAFMDISEITPQPESPSPSKFFTPQSTTPFEWKFPSELEKSVTSLSSVADAIYLNLTGELPPSIKQYSEKKRNGKAAIANTSNITHFSFSDDSNSAQTPNKFSKLEKSIPMFTLSDQEVCEEHSSDASLISEALSLSEESDSEHERAMSDFDASDLILGVSSSARNSFAGHQGDDAMAIANLLRRSSSEPSCWKVDAVDKMPHLASRYYQPSQNTICTTCSKKGHDANECSRMGPVCILCGNEGHFSSRCPVKYCSICLGSGHNYADCHQRFRLRDEICSRCKQTGHSRNLCTEIWRQYRDTTRDGEPIPIASFKAPKSCCNCGRHGHTVDDCRSRPFRRGMLVHRRILVYDKRNVYERRLAKTVRTRKEKILRGSQKSQRLPKATRYGDAARQAKGRRQRGQELLEVPLTSRQQANLKRVAVVASRRFEQNRLSEGVSKKGTIRQLKEARRIEKAEKRIERKLNRQVLKQYMYPKMNKFGDSCTTYSLATTTSKVCQGNMEVEDEKKITRNAREEEPEYLGFDNSTCRPTTPYTTSSFGLHQVLPSRSRGNAQAILNGGKRHRSVHDGDGKRRRDNRTTSRRGRNNNAAQFAPGNDKKNEAPHYNRVIMDSQFNPDWIFDGQSQGTSVQPRDNSEIFGNQQLLKGKAVEDEDWYKRAISQSHINSWDP